MLYFIFLLLLQYIQSSPQQFDPNIAKNILSLIDFSTDPCSDFYQFACGTWINTTVIPKDKSRYTRSFDTIEKHNKEILLSIVTNFTYSNKLNYFYNSCLDLAMIDDMGDWPLFEDYVLMEGALDPESLMSALVDFNIRGIDAFFTFTSTLDAENPTLVIGQFDQGGLGLPYPSLYTSSDPHSTQIRAAYLQHITNMFNLTGEEDPVAAAKMAYSIEYEIAVFTIDPDQLTNPFTTYNRFSASQFQEQYSGLPWNVYFSTLQKRGVTVENVTVTVPSFFGNLTGLIVGGQNSLQFYLTWCILRTRSPLLSTPLRNEHFNFFNKILRGQEEPAPLSDQCIDVIDSSLGELLGEFFNQISFPGESEQEALQILADIISAMNFDINNITWMDPATQQAALKKLSLVAHLIGAPEKPDQYDSITITNMFFDNVVNCIIYNRLNSLAEIGTPSVRTQWGITAPTVNAYYDPSRNIMVFPSGILQQPFFNVSYPQSMNYGGIGLVMGHELTHGFDNQGRLYDGTGKLTNWWDDVTNAKFNDKVECVINQYSGFEVIPGVFINGKLTQGENIADMGGIKNSFHAYSQKENINSPSFVPNFSNGQLFFLSFAQTWCEKATDAYRRIQVQTDPHSPAMYRVLGPLMNLPNFGEVWKCPQGSRMNDPKTRCEVW